MLLKGFYSAGVSGCDPIIAVLFHQNYLKIIQIITAEFKFNGGVAMIPVARGGGIGDQYVVIRRVLNDGSSGTKISGDGPGWSAPCLAYFRSAGILAPKVDYFK